MENEEDIPVGKRSIPLLTCEVPFERIVPEGTATQDAFFKNPLVRRINGILQHIESYKERAKEFYFQVMLSNYACPTCGRGITMSGQSECTCQGGHVFDPTVAFQTSPCCQAPLVRKTFHYSCSTCHKTVPSRFIFDERLFDAEYFRQMMQESRNRSREKREAIRRLLAESRSGELVLMENPESDILSDFSKDLDAFILENPMAAYTDFFDLKSDFDLNAYRSHILAVLGHHTLLFSSISPLIEDCRCDRARRFTALIFMDNDREVVLQQSGDDLLIRRCNDEAYAEG